MKMSPQFRAHSFAAGLVAGCGVLYIFVPSEHTFYPRCLFHSLTGLQCPGCGGTRALYQLLHLHISEALRLNALVTILAPVALAWFVFWYWTVVRDGRGPELRVSRPVAVCLYLIVLFFTAARNGAFSFLI
jgi:hypothetical protein